MPEPLPSNLPLHFEDSKEVEDAYLKILEIEQRTSAMILISTTRRLEKKLLRIRVLGYLIREAPSKKARKYVADDVNRCHHEQMIEDLGHHYYTYFIRMFKSNTGRTPEVSSHPSRPEFESKKEMNKDMLRKAGLTASKSQRSKSKGEALVRDDFRCVFSGRYDGPSVDKNQDLKTEWENSGFELLVTQCAHIIPESTNANTSGDKKRDFAASVWAILDGFGYEELPEKLKGRGVNSVDSVMTLNYSTHHWFDALKLWFEAVEGELNTYKVQGTFSGVFSGCKTKDRIITFNSTDDLPAPNLDYLRLHAVCCRVAHMSGAAEHIDEILDDLEDTDVLSEDGSSAHLLSFSIEREMITPQIVAF